MNLYKLSAEHRTILKDPVHRAFDEHIPLKIAGIRIILYKILYLLKLLFEGPRYRLHVPEIRYHFQWYAKKLKSRNSPPLDMTDIVHKASKEKQVKVIFKDLVRSDRAFRRKGRDRWIISWQDGKLTDTNDGDDILAFHFVDSKNDPAFDIKSFVETAENFIISDKGIECVLNDKTGK